MCRAGTTTKVFGPQNTPRTYDETAYDRLFPEEEDGITELIIINLTYVILVVVCIWCKIRYLRR